MVWRPIERALPAEYVGGGELPTSYYVNDLTRSQTQGAVTNTYNLDASLRQRERITSGGSEAGIEIYHYAGGSDSLAWIDEGESNAVVYGTISSTMGKQSSTGRQFKVRLFLAACFLILLAASLIRGKFVLAASGAIGLAWALDSYRWYSRNWSDEQD